MADTDSVFYYKNGTYNRAETADSPEQHSEQPQIPPEHKPPISMKQTQYKSGSVLTIILVSVLAALLLGSVIYTLNRRNSMYNDVTARTNELNLVEAENVRLQSELDSRMSAKNVEDYAENVLGMQKIDSSQIQYIKIQTDDVVSIPEPEESAITKIKHFFNRCLEYFRG